MLSRYPYLPVYRDRPWHTLAGHDNYDLVYKSPSSPSVGPSYDYMWLNSFTPLFDGFVPLSGGLDGLATTNILDDTPHPLLWDYTGDWSISTNDEHLGVGDTYLKCTQNGSTLTFKNNYPSLSDWGFNGDYFYAYLIFDNKSGIVDINGLEFDGRNNAFRYGSFELQGRSSTCIGEYDDPDCGFGEFYDIKQLSFYGTPSGTHIQIDKTPYWFDTPDLFTNIEITVDDVDGEFYLYEIGYLNPGKMVEVVNDTTYKYTSLVDERDFTVAAQYLPKALQVTINNFTENTAATGNFFNVCNGPMVSGGPWGGACGVLGPYPGGTCTGQYEDQIHLIPYYIYPTVGYPKITFWINGTYYERDGVELSIDPGPIAETKIWVYADFGGNFSWSLTPATGVKPANAAILVESANWVSRPYAYGYNYGGFIEYAPFTGNLIAPRNPKLGGGLAYNAMCNTQCSDLNGTYILPRVGVESTYPSYFYVFPSAVMTSCTCQSVSGIAVYGVQNASDDGLSHVGSGKYVHWEANLAGHNYIAAANYNNQFYLATGSSQPWGGGKVYSPIPYFYNTGDLSVAGNVLSMDVGTKYLTPNGIITSTQGSITLDDYEFSQYSPGINIAVCLSGDGSLTQHDSPADGRYLIATLEVGSGVIEGMRDERIMWQKPVWDGFVYGNYPTFSSPQYTSYGGVNYSRIRESNTLTYSNIWYVFDNEIYNYPSGTFNLPGRNYCGRHSIYVDDSQNWQLEQFPDIPNRLHASDIYISGSIVRERANTNASLYVPILKEGIHFRNSSQPLSTQNFVNSRTASPQIVVRPTTYFDLDQFTWEYISQIENVGQIPDNQTNLRYGGMGKYCSLLHIYPTSDYFELFNGWYSDGTNRYGIDGYNKFGHLYFPLEQPQVGYHKTLCFGKTTSTASPQFTNNVDLVTGSGWPNFRISSAVSGTYPQFLPLMHVDWTGYTDDPSEGSFSFTDIRPPVSGDVKYGFESPSGINISVGFGPNYSGIFCWASCVNPQSYWIAGEKYIQESGWSIQLDNDRACWLVYYDENGLGAVSGDYNLGYADLGYTKPTTLGHNYTRQELHDKLPNKLPIAMVEITPEYYIDDVKLGTQFKHYNVAAEGVMLNKTYLYGGFNEHQCIGPPYIEISPIW